MDQITQIFGKIDFLESQGFTYGAKRDWVIGYSDNAVKKKQLKVGFVSKVIYLIVGDPLLLAP